MILKCFDTAELPIYVDTMTIIAVYAMEQANSDKMYVRLVLNSGTTLNVYHAIMFNGVKIINDGSRESVERFLDLFGEIMIIEKDDPSIEKLAVKPKNKKSK